MTRKLFQKYDKETEQWLLQDIRDWPRDKFETEADEGDVELPGLESGFNPGNFNQPLDGITLIVAMFPVMMICLFASIHHYSEPEK